MVGGKEWGFLNVSPNKKAEIRNLYHQEKDTPESLRKEWGIHSLDEFYALNPDARNSWFKGMGLVKPASEDVANYGFNIKERREVDTSNRTNDSFNIACVLPFSWINILIRAQVKNDRNLPLATDKGLNMPFLRLVNMHKSNVK